MPECHVRGRAVVGLSWDAAKLYVMRVIVSEVVDFIQIERREERLPPPSSSHTHEIRERLYTTKRTFSCLGLKRAAPVRTFDRNFLGRLSREVADLINAPRIDQTYSVWSISIRQLNFANVGPRAQKIDEQKFSV